MNSSSSCLEVIVAKAMVNVVDNWKMFKVLEKTLNDLKLGCETGYIARNKTLKKTKIGVKQG